ncbi:MAG: phage holin family protein [Bacteroidia bacterium]|jgi:tetrahydromethanopterin S-methyltransferase subunit F
MDTAQTLKGNIEQYIEDKVDLIKLKASEKAGTVASGVIVGLVVARLVLFILIFLSFAAAFAISQATGKYYLGFLIVAGFYMLLAVAVVLLREKLLTMPLINTFLKKLNFRQHS